MRISDYLRVETRSGEPLQAVGWTITPLTRVVTVQLPFIHGGFIWNRPIEVHVQAGDEPVQKLYVPDTTRQIQWTLLGAGMLLSFLIWLGNRHRRGNHG